MKSVEQQIIDIKNKYQLYETPKDRLILYKEELKALLIEEIEKIPATKLGSHRVRNAIIDSMISDIDANREYLTIKFSENITRKSMYLDFFDNYIGKQKEVNLATLYNYGTNWENKEAKFPRGGILDSRINHVKYYFPHRNPYVCMHKNWTTEWIGENHGFVERAVARFVGKYPETSKWITIE